MRFILLLNLVLLSFVNEIAYGAAEKLDIDVSKTIVWGPGLDPERITLRARYIFLQLVDSQGKNLTVSPGKNLIRSEINGESEKGVAFGIYTQVLDSKDGSFIIQYRISKTCFNLNIVLKVQDEILPLKQSWFKGPIYEEECYCPNESVDSWLQNNNCDLNHSQILEDLKPFPRVNFNNLRAKLIKTYNKPNSVSICHYVIKSNRVYRQCYGQHVGFKTFVDENLLSLTRKTTLPDVEFFMNLGDWPLVPKNKELFPIFSWCGSEDTNDIVIPTYEITKASIEAMGSVMLTTLSVQGNTKLPWNKKIEKLFWKGRDSCRERLDLIDIARRNPDLFNASITNFFFFKNDIKKYGPETKYISFFEFFKYKYQLNIDGTVAAYRFPFLLAGDSLVFKQNSKYYEYFYKYVEAGKHYIPVEKNLSNLVEKVKWAIKNDDKAYKITREAREFVRSNLLPQNIFCYHVALIKEWSQRLESVVEVLPEMEEVLQPNYECNCNRKTIKDEL